MNLFFLIVRAVRAGYKALRAAAGILILTHGVYRWLKNHMAQRQAPARRPKLRAV